MSLLDARRLALVEACVRETLHPADFTADALAWEHWRSGGKHLRATLAFAVGDALGVDEARSARLGGACDLLHNATLVHDDVQDGDTERRGTPTLWARHGVPQAINAGDLLFFCALDLVEGLRDANLTPLFSRCARAVIRGQAEEFAWRHQAAKNLEPPVTWAEYERIAALKTGALFVLPVVGTALLAGATHNEALPRFAEALGVCFQVRDDLLDVEGSKGRPPGTDIREGKLSSVLLAYVELGGDMSAMWPLLGNPEDAGAVAYALGLFAQCGAAAHAREALAQRRARLAQQLHGLEPRLALGLAPLVESVLA